MFEKLKNRIGTLEHEVAQLKADLAETKRIFSKLAGENAGLRAENDRLIKLGGIAPAFPVKRHQWPDTTVRDTG